MERQPLRTAIELGQGAANYLLERLVYLGGWAGHSDLKAPPANIQIFEDLPTHERVNFGQIPGPSMKTESKDGGV